MQCNAIDLRSTKDGTPLSPSVPASIVPGKDPRNHQFVSLNGVARVMESPLFPTLNYSSVHVSWLRSAVRIGRPRRMPALSRRIALGTHRCIYSVGSRGISAIRSGLSLPPLVLFMLLSLKRRVSEWIELPW